MQGNRFIENVIYSLKRDFPKQVTLCLESTTPNLDTGAIAKTETVYQISRAIALPSDWKRKFSYDLSFLAANKNFAYGALYDTNAKVIIIDAKDIPKNLEINLDYTLVIDTKRYQLTEAVMLEDYRAWILTAKYTSGAKPNAIRFVKAQDRIVFSETIVDELNT